MFRASDNDGGSARSDDHDPPPSGSGPSVSPPPRGPLPTLSDIPSQLRTCDQWVCWKYIWRDNKWSKCPISPIDGSRASSTDPRTWTSVERALARASSDPSMAGIGFVFSKDDLFAGIDLDDCIDDSGQITPAAQALIDRFGSYAEVSPSGRGVKVFVGGKKPEGAGCRVGNVHGCGEVEVYDRGRFFTFTGKRLGEHTDIEAAHDELEDLCDELWPETRVGCAPAAPTLRLTALLSDEQIVQRALGSTDEKFKRLFAGDTSDYGNDHSRADLALCGKLAFWTGKDPEQMDAIFRTSGLMRAKWNEPRGGDTYGLRTIRKAIESCTSTFGGGSAVAGDTQDSGGAGTTDAGTSSGGGLGARDPVSNKLVLSEARTLPTARAFVSERYNHPDHDTLVDHGDMLLAWRDNRWVEVEAAGVRAELAPWLDAAVKYKNPARGDFTLVPFHSNPRTVGAALQSVRDMVHLPVATPNPSWLEPDPERPPVSEILACRSFNLHIPTRRMLPATPLFFTTSALDFDYQQDPEPPLAWIKFMEQVFGADLDAMGCLQEFMGYCVTPDTSLQKMLLIIGPKRSGKGTISKVLEELVGRTNVVRPTIHGLENDFGLAPFIGKSVGIVSDARFGGGCPSAVTERLLCISGEDALTINRKHLNPITLKLPTRMIFLTNEIPRFNDASTALASRFVVLQLQNSFFGKEDPKLIDKLLKELPGILHWALAGLDRLRERGRFQQPESSKDVLEELEDLSSPVGAFVRDQCEIGAGYRVPVQELYQSYVAWCADTGREAVAHAQGFGRDLRAVVNVVSKRNDDGRFYAGIRLKAPFR